MEIDLSKLKEYELRTYSYEDTLKVVDELEQLSASRFSGIPAIETSETYYAFALLINNRVENGEFPELAPKHKKNEKAGLEHRLTVMISNLKYTLELGKLNSRLKAVDEEKAALNDKILLVEQRVAETVDDYTAKKKEIISNVNAFEHRMDNSEHEILAHVLTLMGIFSAIITIILSVIITSSSWINNADRADAVIAFVVPNSVALLAVALLMSLIFLHIPVSSKRNNNNSMWRSTACKGIIIAIILVVLISGVCLFLAKETTYHHVIHILSPGEYRVVPEAVAVTNASEIDKEQVEYYFEFELDQTLYRFKYDKNFMHDNKLYFCEVHNALE